jgi:hypothetical protein
VTDALQDIRDYFTDRFSSPFWVSFIVTWLLINWELPITAIFETDKFTVTFISAYLAKIQSWYTWQLPALLATTYAIFSSSVKEIIDILSKLIRSIFSYLDRKGKLYKSISLIEHEKEIARLERRLQKENKFKEELAEFSLENKRLEEEISSLRLELKNRQDYQSHNSKLSLENDELIKLISDANNQTDEQQPEDIESKKEESNEPPLTYFEIIRTSCKKDTIKSFYDINSRENLLLILEIVNNKKFYSVEEMAKNSGMPKGQFGKILNLASQAGLTSGNSNFITLSESGKNKLNELKNDNYLSDLVKALDNIDLLSKSEIISTLRKKSLTLEDIKNTVSFNPNIKTILELLIKDEKIHKEGSVYFYGKPNLLSPNPQSRQ